MGERPDPNICGVGGRRGTEGHRVGHRPPSNPSGAAGFIEVEVRDGFGPGWIERSGLVEVVGGPGNYDLPRTRFALCCNGCGTPYG